MAARKERRDKENEPKPVDQLNFFKHMSKENQKKLLPSNYQCTLEKYKPSQPKSTRGESSSSSVHNKEQSLIEKRMK